MDDLAAVRSSSILLEIEGSAAQSSAFPTHLMNYRVGLRTFYASFLLLIPSQGADLPTRRFSIEVENTSASTTLTAMVKGSESPVKFRIDWVHGTETPENFKNHPEDTGSFISTHLLGKTTLTRTILASAEADCIFIHVHSDQPGSVHFSARFLTEDPVEIHDRRQLILSGKGIHAHSWIIPYESDVSDDQKSTITLAGEGEALIILNLTDHPTKNPIADTLTRLGEKYDPGNTPPSPHLIWDGVIEGEENESSGPEKTTKPPER